MKRRNNVICSPSHAVQIRASDILGAEVTGIDLSTPVAECIKKQLREALLEYGMLLIRKQPLNPLQQIELARCFGSQLHEAGPKLRKIPAFPEIFRISNRRHEGNYNTGQYWHCDGHYLADPSSITVMHMIEATPDGPTLVSSLAAAFERLPHRMKTELSRLGSIAPETGVMQPLVRKHPVTGTTGLYVNLRAKTVNRFGQLMPHIDNALEQHLNQGGTFYCQQWQKGDSLIVDNFAVCHRGLPADPINLRVMHRITVTGSGAWWRSLHAGERSDELMSTIGWNV